MKIIEQYSEPKSNATPSEDMVALTACKAAVIDGATSKTSFRLPNGETPGHFAARIIARAVTEGLSEVDHISAYLRSEIECAVPDRADGGWICASMVLLDTMRREVVQVGDAPFAFVYADGSLIEHRNTKRIDDVLAQWRSDALRSMLSRGVVQLEDVIRDDPGRRLIQPFITRQVVYQNTLLEPYGFGVMDGGEVPSSYVRRFRVTDSIREVILASDGFPVICRTLTESLDLLSSAIRADPLCICQLEGTKGLRSGAQFPDDATYVRISLQDGK